MDPKPFQARLDQSKAALAKQEAALKNAQANLARVKPLTSLNALSQRDFDDATGNAHSTAAAVEQAKAQVEIILVDGTIFPHKGRITFADPMYSSQTGTFLIRSSVQNPKGILRPNQYVRVRVKGNVRPAAILIPQQAGQSGAKGHFVWIVSPDGTVRPRPVELGDWYGNSWFINDGLKAGETVVVEGGLALQPDARVRTKPFVAGPLSSSGEGKPVADDSRSNPPTVRN